MSNQELSAAVLALQQSHHTLQLQHNMMNDENLLQAQNIRANENI